MTDRELLDQIWLKLLGLEAILCAVEKKTECNHDFVETAWGTDEPKEYTCKRCGAKSV